MGRTIDELPRLGWVRQPSPVTALESLGRSLGLEYLGVKRDDQLEALYGGAKVRKLDHLLAIPPFDQAPIWASVGAIGSGHLTAVTAAAQQFGRKLEAHCFWEPLSDGVLENLAFTASGPTFLHYYPSRGSLAFRQWSLLQGRGTADAPVIPPGGTCPGAMVGLVRAGLELAEQIREGALPEPERIYVALGSGGTTAGLAVGLGLGGVNTTLHAVATVERILSRKARLVSLITALRRWLQERGVDLHGREPVPVVIDRSQLGAAYGVSTAASLAACELLAREGLALEPIYTGKTMAALLADVSRTGRPSKVLFWNTARRGPLPVDPRWRERLPHPLARRLNRVTREHSIGRRAVLGLAAAAVTGLAWGRLSGYPEVPDWRGEVLSAREALVVAAAAEALLPVRPSGPAPLAVAANVDRMLVSMSPGTVGEIHLLLALVEHGTTPLGLRLSRFTSLPPEAREAYLAGLSARGGQLALAYRGLRDLCLFGYYQEPASWSELDYPGPWGPAAVPHQVTPYESFRAPAGAKPRGAVG